MEMVQRKPNILILLSGLATSFISLLIVFLLDMVEINLMGLYILFILPAGGILVGAGSGAGYALSSWKFNLRIEKTYFLIIIILALGTYAASHYITYRAALQAEGLTEADVNFFQYLQYTAETMTYSFRGGSEEGVSLGAFGYVFLVVEALGFATGTFLPLFFLSKTAYCPNCQLYMKKTVTAYFPAASTWEGFKKTPRKEKSAYLNQAISEATARYQELVPQLSGKGIEEIRSMLELNKARTGRMLAHVQVTLYRCPTGDTAVVKPSVVNLGLDGKPHSQSMAEIKKGEAIIMPV